MKLCLLSDLHLDHHKDGGVEFMRQLVIPECDLIVVAGDLSQVDHWRWKQSVKEICNKSNQVLYVLGNHEYYTSTLVEVDCKSHKLSEEIPNLVVASRAKILTNKEIPALENLSLLAGTLWFQDFPDQIYYKKFLNDFEYIERLEPEIYRRNERFDVLLHGVKDEPCLVISHHMPSYRSVNCNYIGSALNRFFVGGEFEKVIESSKIKLWCHGHGHDAVDYKIGSTRIISNPAGYPREIKANWQPLILDV